MLILVRSFLFKDWYPETPTDLLEPHYGWITACEKPQNENNIKNKNPKKNPKKNPNKKQIKRQRQAGNSRKEQREGVGKGLYLLHHLIFCNTD